MVVWKQEFIYFQFKSNKIRHFSMSSSNQKSNIKISFSVTFHERYEKNDNTIPISYFIFWKLTFSKFQTDRQTLLKESWNKTKSLVNLKIVFHPSHSWMLGHCPKVFNGGWVVPDILIQKKWEIISEFILNVCICCFLLNSSSLFSGFPNLI